jgi:hypothetical protein
VLNFKLTYIFGILLFVVFYPSTNSFSQCSNFVYEDKKYPGMCVESIIKMVNDSQNSWDYSMGRFDFEDNGFERGAPYYSMGNFMTGKSVNLTITKEFDLLKIENVVDGNATKLNIFLLIIMEIDDYFVRSSDGWNFFIFRYTDGELYEFCLNQSEDIDLLWVRKLK